MQIADHALLGDSKPFFGQILWTLDVCVSMSVGDVAARAMAGLTARCCLVVGLGGGLDAEGKKM
jgi:hypothetical protein